MGIEIRIEGFLEDHWKEWLGDLTITETEQNVTVLSGQMTDQAALYGLIAKLRDLGVTLISINFVESR